MPHKKPIPTLHLFAAGDRGDLVCHSGSPANGADRIQNVDPIGRPGSLQDDTLKKLNMPKPTKNLHLFAAGFLLAGFIGGILTVPSALAQLATVATDANTAATAINTGILAGTEQGREIRGTLWSHLKLAGAMGIHTAVANFTQQLAMDFATDIAEAGSGKQPLLFGQPFENYVAGLGLQAAADFIGEVSKPFESVFGFSLCEPSLNFRVGFILPVIKARFEPPKHRCKWKKLVSNWQEFGGSFGSDKELLEHISLGFTPSGNDIGVFLAVNDKLDLKLQQEIFSKILDRQEGQGWKAVADVVTGNVKTPAQLVKTEVDANAVRPYSVSADTVSRAYMSTLSDPTFWIATAVSPFFNTLASKASQRLLQKGLISLIPEEEIELGALGGSGAGGGRTTSGGTAGFRQEIAGLATPTTLTTYDPISEMVSCPPEPSRQPNNCVMDTGLASAIRLAQTGKALTLACAMDPACARQEYLHGGWPLLGPEEEQRPCVDGAYCYSNLVKLRQLRILPLGFEIAALNSGRQRLSRAEAPRFASRDADQVLRLASLEPSGSNSPSSIVVPTPSDAILDRPVTLKEAVDNFNNPASVFYHLIDPNWVIKLPLTRCDAKVFSSSLVVQGATSRAEVCVDTPSCIAQDSRGNCLGWGHCLREQNVWKFPGQSCPAQFSSCLTLSDSRGKQASYLFDTMERCDVSSAGCRWYSTLKASDDSKWLDPEDQGIWKNRLYLKNSQQCTKEQEGCSQFKVANSSDPYFFKEAPDYYHCEDYTKELTNTRYALSDNNRITNCTNDGFLWRDDIQRCVGRSASASSNLSCPTGTNKNSKWQVGNTNTPYCISKPSAECARFARACTAQEVGCLAYTPVTNAGPEVPGKITPRVPASAPDQAVTDWNDECPATCVGYNRYTAVKQFWDNNGSTSYGENFIPSLARQCQAAEVGCTEFTNLTVGGAAEQKTYFKTWKSCIVPGPDSATFYTWEGSDVKGFQLKAWSLKKHSSTGGPELQGGKAPATDINSGSDTTCSKSIYNKKPNEADYNADCREFFDASGRRYYVIAARTITSSPDCQTFRKTAVDENNDSTYDLDDCPGGSWINGSCLVSFIAKNGEATSCSAPAAGCREYVGTAAANTRTVVQDAFEDGQVGDWSGIVRKNNSNSNLPQLYARLGISNSDLHVGGYSLAYEVDANQGVQNVTLRKSLAVVSATTVPVVGQVKNGKYYELTFTAKTENTTTVYTKVNFDGVIPPSGYSTWFGPMTETTNPNVTWPYSTLTNDWRFYRFRTFAPLNIVAGTSSVPLQIFFDLTSGRVNIDNITLKEVTKSVTVIQGSWQIPASCTADSPTGRGDKDVNMFGCAAYKQGQETINLRSFTSLCRQEALGCQAYTKTFNYEASSAGIKFNESNDKCVLTNACNPSGLNSSCPCYAKDKPMTAYFKLCDVADGASECAYTPGLSDNITIPSHQTVYRVVTQSTSCTSAFKGCQALGEPVSAASTGMPFPGPTSDAFSRVALSVNECDLGRFCEQDGGCECEASDGSGAKCTVAKDHDRCQLPFRTIYVKNNPDLYESGDGLLCTVSEDRCEAFTYRDGQNRTAQIGAKKPFQRVCDWRDGVVVNGVSQSGWFIKGTDLSCPQSSALDHAATVIENNYRGFVAACRPEHNLCTQFVDPRAPAAPYYVISTANLDRSSCQGQVSEKFGCIPFVESSSSNQDLQGNLVFDLNSGLSFKDSADHQNDLVPKVNCDRTNGHVSDSRCATQSGARAKFCVSTRGVEETCVNYNSDGSVQTCSLPGGCSCQLAEDSQVSCIIPNGLTSCETAPARLIGPSCNNLSNCPSISIPIISGFPPQVTGQNTVNFYDACQELANDANTIIKVDRDRQCGEWLACRSSSTVFDPRTNQQRQVCQQFDLCSQLAPDGSCADGKFVPALKSSGGLNPERVNFLDRQTYQNRGNTTAPTGGIAWADQDFSGYSMYLFDRRSNKQGAYQPYDLQQVNIKTPEDPDIRLVYVSPLAADYTTCQQSSVVSGATECGTDNLVGVKGTCYTGKCVWAADGRKVETQNETAFPKSCRGYPESEAPFKSELKGSGGQLPNGFENIKLCEEENGACDCSYQKVSYKGGMAKYYGSMSENVAAGFCSGGLNDGKPCDGPNDKVKCADRNDETNNGRCMAKEKVQPFLGWQGYCLQKDRQTRINGNEREFACATWLPLDQAQGSQDLYNQYDDAGFNPDNKELLYCAVKQANKNVVFNALSANSQTDYSLTERSPIGGYYENDGVRDHDELMPQTFMFWGGPRNGGWLASSGILENDLSVNNSIGKAGNQPVTLSNLSLLNLTEIEIKLGSGEADDWPENGRLILREPRWQDAWCEDYTKSPCSDWIAQGWLTNGDTESSLEKDIFDYGSPIRTRITTAAKDQCEDGTELNHLAAQARFDANDNFIGFFAGLCDSSDDNGYITVDKIIFKLRNACEAPVLTVSSSGTENQAFTDRLASGSPFTAGNGGRRTDVREPYAAIDRSLEPVNDPIVIPQMSKRSFGCYEAHGGGCVDKSNPNTFTKAFEDAVNEIASDTVGLFRKIYKAWNWSGTQYTTKSQPSGVVYDQTNSYRPEFAPKIAQVKRREGDRLGNLGAITVADRIGGVVRGTKSLDASISFYAWADRNHLPLRKIEVDFGDGSQAIQNIGKFKNSKPYCSMTNEGRASLEHGTVKVCFAPPINLASRPDLNITCKENSDCEGVLGVGALCGTPGISDDDEPQGLATTPWNSKGNRPEACDPHFREYFHTYTCGFGNLPATTCTAGDPGRTIQANGCKELGTDGKWYCIFKPRAQVKDNWGWCNGGYGGFSNNGTPNDTSDDTTNLSCPNSWAEFPGEVRVSAN